MGFFSGCFRSALIASFFVLLCFILELSAQGQVDSAVTTETARSNCPAGFVDIGSRCYLFSTNKKSWYDSFKACNGYQARLATLSNCADNKNLKEFLQLNYPNVSGVAGWWIGGIDEALEGDWLWSGTLTKLAYTDWCDNSGEPNNYGGENCLCMVPTCSFQWNDRSCDYRQFRYICEYYSLPRES